MMKEKERERERDQELGKQEEIRKE